MFLLRVFIFFLISANSFSSEIPANIRFSSSNPSSSQRLLEELNLAPVKSLEVQNAKFHLTQIFHFDQTIPSDGRKRYGVFAYIEVKGEKTLRFFYKSSSHGIFRLAPFIVYIHGENWEGKENVAIKWYSKGIGEGSLALPPVVQSYLAKEITDTEARTDITILHIANLIASYNDYTSYLENETYEEYILRVTTAFNKFRDEQDKLMAQEVTFYKGLLEEPTLEERKFSYKDEERVDYFAKPESIIFSNPEDLPDFKNGNIKESEYSILHYGKVKGFVFNSKNSNLQYYLIKNNEGKIWIPSMSFVGGDSIITSYGVPSKAIRYDEVYFLMPLWERSKYIHPDFRSEQIIPRESKYQSSWVYLSNINIIKSFYRDLGIILPTDVPNDQSKYMSR